MRKGLFALLTAVVLSALAVPAQAIQCVPYARQISGIDLKGDAWMWWNAAAGRYDRGRTPQTDAVMVFGRQGSMRYGHVSVVSKVVNSRMILVDHANWAPVRSAGRGAITKLVPVLDVSPKNDWSRVRVWYEPGSTFGSKVYRTDGFVYNPNRRTAPAKGGVQKVALSSRTSIALATMGNQLADVEARFSDDTDAFVGHVDEQPAAPAAKIAPVKAAKAETVAALQPAPASVAPVAVAVAAVPQPVAAATPAPAAAVVATTIAAVTPAAPASVEVNDNLGAAISVAKTSFGGRGRDHSVFN